jgi:hypothetical protein
MCLRTMLFPAEESIVMERLAEMSEVLAGAPGGPVTDGSGRGQSDLPNGAARC